MNKREKGFSLIELLIVVAIILIIAAIAIPNLLRSRMAANEASAVGSIRTINTAQVTYNSTYNDGFSPNLATMGGPAGAAATCNQAELIDPLLSAGQKTGYTFVVGPGSVPVTTVPAGCGGPGNVDGYTVTGTPVSVGTTGQRAFCSDGSGVIQFNSTGAAIAPGAAPPICPAGLSSLGN